jgi:hypothetical protein
MRFRRVMFGLVPEFFRDSDSEQDYISKFKRLLEYLGKLREKSVQDSPIDVKIVTSMDPAAEIEDIFEVLHPSEDSMIKLTIPLKRLKGDPFEWMEIAIESTFDTRSSYRIMFNWLVASSAKVETQVQLFHRRCSQFGLQTMCFPQTTISRDLFLHSVSLLDDALSFARPTLTLLPHYSSSRFPLYSRYATRRRVIKWCKICSSLSLSMTVFVSLMGRFLTALNEVMSLTFQSIETENLEEYPVVSTFIGPEPCSFGTSEIVRAGRSSLESRIIDKQTSTTIVAQRRWS